MTGSYIGIDLGTANTLVCTKHGGIIIREPSYVTYHSRSNHVISVGDEAKTMYGKTPPYINAMRPLREGVIADFELTSEMLKVFIKKAVGNSILISKPNIVICIPYGVTDVEKKAVQEAALEAGAKSVALIEEPVAAAIGAGLPIKAACGCMVVDIGGGTTEVAVISLGGIANSASLRIAGDKCTEAIVSYIKKRFNVVIGESTAEDIKIAIGSAHPSTDFGVIEVRGRNVLTGLPAALNVYSSDIREALEEPLNAIVDVIKTTLEATAPELCSDIYDNGIMLTGGGALLSGIDTLISEKTHLNVYVSKDPLDCVANGIIKVMQTKDKEVLLSEMKSE
ncbi:MAG: rod shape-determining protein [Ruminococcaceae bacterium]|nr:rod shape-determining protein [Oscillospiraceae bacterium]